MTDAFLRNISASDRDWLVREHAQFYAESDGFDGSFGVLVGEIVDAFLKDHDTTCERAWIAETENLRLGSVFCVRLDETTAQLRLFFLLPQARGQGLGARLLQTCMHFAQEAGYHGMQLWTHQSHAAACRLYRSFGWQLIDTRNSRSFGQEMIVETYRFRF